MSRTTEGGITQVELALGDVEAQLNQKTIEDIAKLVAGKASVNVAGSGNYTLGSVLESDARTLFLTFTGALTGNRPVVIPVTEAGRLFIMLNNTTGAFTLSVITSAGGSTGVTLPAGVPHLLYHDGTHVYSLSGGTPWTAVTFQNSWVNYALTYQEAQYRKVGDLVQVRGAVKSGTVGTTIFTLPAGYRPPAKLNVFADLNGAFGRLEVASTGAVTQVAPTGNTFVAFNFQFSVTS